MSSNTIYYNFVALDILSLTKVKSSGIEAINKPGYLLDFVLATAGAGRLRHLRRNLSL